MRSLAIRLQGASALSRVCLTVFGAGNIPQQLVSVLSSLVAPVAQRYHLTSDTLGREFDPGKRIFLTEKLKNENKNAQRVEND